MQRLVTDTNPQQAMPYKQIYFLKSKVIRKVIHFSKSTPACYEVIMQPQVQNALGDPARSRY